MRRIHAAQQGAVWPLIQRFYDPQFVQEIDRIVEEDSTTWLELLLP